MTISTIDDVFRDYVVDGVSTSGPNHPNKADIRDTLKSLLEGISTFPDNRVIRLNNANAGTENNIIVTASVAIPAAAFQVLYILNVTQENTGPVKVTGAITRDLVTNTSQPVQEGYLKPGMAVLCIDTGNALRMLLDGKRWSDPISERPHAGQVEIWSFVNLSGDAHPVHLHLVRFQVLDRRPFDLFAWNAHRQLKYTGPAEQPPPHEAGWKDTVRADPGMVTRIAVRFEGEPGRYVWHCHLLEHEDNEMMRPYELLPG